MDAPAIEVRALRAGYRGRNVLCGVDLDIRPGRLTAVLGPNGGGKSTLLRVLAGLLPYTHGSIRIAGREWRSVPARTRAEWVGFLPQEHRAIFPFAVRDVVLTGRAGRTGWRPGLRDLEAAERAMAEMDLVALADRPYTELSGGERQRVLIARVLAQEPRMLLFDEPTAHLDVLRQMELLRVARRWIRGGGTALCVLHDPNLAFAWADDILPLRDGAVCLPESGEPAWSEGFLRRLYGFELRTLPVGARAAAVPSDRAAPWGRESLDAAFPPATGH